MGVALGLQFNPLFGVAGAMIAAVLMGYPKAPENRRPIAAGVLALAWLAGDGARIGASLTSSPPRTWYEWTPLVLWAVVGALVGYLAPAAAGIMAGRRVVRGTGWLTAAAVALMVAGAIALVTPTLADGVARLTGAGG